MKFTVDRADIAPALSALKRVVPSKVTIPVIANLKLAVVGDELEITATDLDREVTRTIAINGEVDGETTVPAALLDGVVSKSALGAQVGFEQDGDFLKVVTGKRTMRMATLQADRFPEMKRDEAGCTISGSAVSLAAHLKSVAYAISTEEARYYLNGIYIDKPDGCDGFMMTATDGLRLGNVRVSDLSVGGAFVEAIIPREAVAEIIAICAKLDEEVELEIGEAKLELRFSGGRMVSKLIDGKFPDYERVIPKSNEHKAICDRAHLAQGVSAIAMLSEKGSSGIKLEFDRDTLVLTARNETGDARDEMGVESEDTDPFFVGVSAKYLAEFLNLNDCPAIDMRIGAPKSPLLLKPDGTEGVRHVLMPMALKF